VPQLIGSTTLATRRCDEGMIDRGFHWSNFDVSNVGQSMLTADFEARAKTIGSLQYFNSGKIKIAFFDSCDCGSYIYMAIALGMYSTMNQIFYDQVYLSWDNTIGTYPPYSSWRMRFWDSPNALGGPHSVYEALMYDHQTIPGNIPNDRIRAWGYAQDETLYCSRLKFAHTHT
jgi:hypothetical protein